KICSCDIEQVTGFHSSFSLNERTRSFLKVQDGCDYGCSFCTIPKARGKSRSDSIENILKNARDLAAKGVQEIVLTGVNLGDFRTPALSTSAGGGIPQANFFQLIQELDCIDGIERFRISSIEPNLLTNEIIRFVAKSKKFMPHFHIPLQSGSDRILGLMRRRYKKELYQERVKLIKTSIPHSAIGADVIVGFPGESDEDFKETYQFLHSLEVSYLHVFTYSERDNTRALEIKPVVPLHVRHERNKALRNLSYMKMQYFTQLQRGQVRKVLFEGHSKGPLMEGYTDNYIRVQVPYRNDWVNQIVDWQL
ncbi:MAG TPA: MiaB/RimO family radical SAM methylthiotransferase, partial [Puia sp.]|nr:MiaB/RimO family radical SAM methylthiotransferase [Puia sp.]